jgi:hypothetical protein
MRLKNHYTDEANLYQQTYAAFMKEKTGFNPGGRMMRIKESIGGDGEEEQPKPIDPNELPGFQYQEIGLGDAVTDALPDIGLLLVYSLLAFAGSLAAFNRYDLR